MRDNREFKRSNTKFDSGKTRKIAFVKEENANQEPKESKDNPERHLPQSANQNKKIVNKNTREYADKIIARRKRIVVLVICLVILAILASIFFTGFAVKTSLSNKIIKGVTINDIDVSGLTEKEAIQKINSQIENSKIKDVKLTYSDFETKVSRDDLDIVHNVDEAVKEAFKIGRKDGIIANNMKVINSMFNSENVKINVNYNSEMMESILKDIDKNLPGHLAEYTYCIEDDELIITNGTKGVILNNDKMKEDILYRLSENIKAKDDSKIEIPVEEKTPEKIDIEKIYEEVHVHKKRPNRNYC